MLWIWENAAAQADEYADFVSSFSARPGEDVRLSVSVDGGYAAYLNGTLVACSPFADYPYRRAVNETLLTPHLADGENALTLTVWHYGAPSSVYCPGPAGVRFAVTSGDRILAQSDGTTLCRPTPGYVPHLCKVITGQMGFSYTYDANLDAAPLHPAVPLADYDPPLYERPILPLEVGEAVPGRVIGGDGATHFLLDLGREEVGHLALSLEAAERTEILVTYGEHIVDGGVRRRIGTRDFSVTYIARPGENCFENHLRRLGARYLEIFTDRPITLRTAGLRPTLYPVTELPYRASGALRQKIYDVCVRTLRLCMHEHYEDCPWREQALYAMDSRNQMLAGYRAFGETRFARASLRLMADDRREDGLLAITYPCGMDLTIPSFSLHYYTEMLEYTEFSGDTTLAAEVWDKLVSVLSVFTDRIADGLPQSFTAACHWNFYEWSEGLSGNLGRESEPKQSLVLACLLVSAIESMQKLAALTGKKYDCPVLPEEIRAAIRREFRREDGLYADFAGEARASELGQAVAILAGAADGADAHAIAPQLLGGSGALTPVTLSMKCFVYDALLKTDRETYAPVILADIDCVYGRMLEAGATSFWETELGEADFDRAGSLCHGWSAMAAYYLRVLEP